MPEPYLLTLVTVVAAEDAEDITAQTNEALDALEDQFGILCHEAAAIKLDRASLQPETLRDLGLID